MKNKHILNIGYPKTSTTWLWRQLSYQPWFSQPREKENEDLILGVSVSDYAKQYLNFNITANFCTSNFALDRYIINQLSQNRNIFPTLILRNPFDYHWSMFNFTKSSASDNYSDSLKNLIDQEWYSNHSKIINRWQQYFDHDRFFIFSYDEICIDSEKFFLKYCDKLQLPKVYKITNNRINVTDYSESDRRLDDEIVEKINQEIDNMQPMISFNIQHWKQDLNKN
jgi:hypothetical protein